MLKNKLFPIVVPALICWPLLAFAQSIDKETDKTDRPLEEVVVSALREQSVSDVNASISSLDRESIESSSAQHFQDLFQQIPNLNLSGEGSRARYFQLRGIGELEQYEGAPNPSVGFIFDDIDLSGVGGISKLFDIQRIEVLRGPQATRFGANAIGGLVYVQSAEASPKSEFSAQVSTGNDGAAGIGFSMGGKLGERTNGRLSVHHSESDGFYDNVSLGTDNSNGRDELLANGKLEWTGDKDWRVNFSLLFANFDNGYDAWSPLNGRTTYSDHPGRDEQQTTGLSAHVSGPLSGSIDFVSITAFADSDILFSYDGEWGNESFWAPYGYNYQYSDQRDRKTLSQEFRLISTAASRLFGDRSDWVLGIYAQRLEESNRILSEGIYDDSVDAPLAYCTPCLDRNSLDSAYDSANFAIFGKLDTILTDRLSVSIGLRLERWSADYADVFNDEIYGVPGQALQNAFSPSENLRGGDLSINYELSGQSRLFALISRGYKAGGFNPSLSRALGASPLAGPAAISFRPEQLWNYEAGLKGSWLNDRLSGAFSLFFMDRNDMQVRSSAQYTDNPNDFIYVTSNARGQSRGLEASLNWRLTDAWSFHSSIGLLDSEVEAYKLEREADIPGTLIGREFAHAPSYTMNFGILYLGGSTEKGRWTARLDVNAMDAFYFDYSHDEQSKARQTVDLKIGRRWQKWEATAWVRNLFDENYPTRGFSFGLSPPWFARTRFTRLGDPRHFGFTLKYRH